MYNLFCDKYLKNRTPQTTLHRKRHRKKHYNALKTPYTKFSYYIQKINRNSPGVQDCTFCGMDGQENNNYFSWWVTWKKSWINNSALLSRGCTSVCIFGNDWTFSWKIMHIYKLPVSIKVDLLTMKRRRNVRFSQTTKFFGKKDDATWIKHLQQRFTQIWRNNAEGSMVIREP